MKINIECLTKYYMRQAVNKFKDYPIKLEEARFYLALQFLAEKVAKEKLKEMEQK